MKITIETQVAAPIADVWRAFNEPDDIVKWDASDEWHTISASNDLEVGGQLLLRIATTDNGAGFDVAVTYTQIELDRLIEFRQDDDRIIGRMVRVEFIEENGGITVRQSFDAEPELSEDEQRADWQSVLERFARYVEQSVRMKV